MAPNHARFPQEFLDTVKGKFENPKTKRMVLFTSLPDEEQTRRYEAWRTRQTQADPRTKGKAKGKGKSETALPLRTVKENGIEFATGKPVEFPFLRNTERAARPSADDPFEQKLEPAGFYILHKDTDAEPANGWVTGTVKFNNPLVIAVNRNDERTYGEGSWKRELEAKYGRRGKALTKALRAEGYDGIVTTHTVRGTAYTSEIVALDPDKSVTRGTAGKAARRVASRWLRGRET